MRELDVQCLTDKIAQMVQTINYEYPQDIQASLQASMDTERSPIGLQTLTYLLENARVAKVEHYPICQDTGMVIIFLEVGQDVHFINGSLHDALQKGVEIGYEEGYLRKSVVADPLFQRINTKTNTPAIIYTSIVPGERVVMEVTTKGFGSENMSIVKMLKPAQGEEGVMDTVLEAVKLAGPNACPPMVIGVGIGGTFDYATVLAKKATLRSTASHNPDPQYQELEEELLQRINALNIGPQGLKGDTTALAVNIEQHPTHIAGLPCAVNISCHVTRHAKEVI